MLRLNVKGLELFDEATQEFTNLEGLTVDLEHSLLSLSKWESRFEKPFLGSDSKSMEETLGYILSMVISPESPPDFTSQLTSDDFTAINKYIEAKHSATTFREMPGSNTPSREIITSELIYYWLVALQIPFDPCEGWHLNRLFNLIRVCNIKNSTDKKMPKHAVAQQNRDLNAARKAKLGTSG